MNIRPTIASDLAPCGALLKTSELTRCGENDTICVNHIWTWPDRVEMIRFALSQRIADDGHGVHEGSKLTCAARLAA